MLFLPGSLVERGMFLFRKDGRIIASLPLVVTDVIYDDGGFLLQYQAAYPADKLFRIHLVHIKLFWSFNRTQNPGDGLAGQSGVGGYLSSRSYFTVLTTSVLQVIMLHFFLHHHARLHVVVLQFRLLHSSGYHVAQFETTSSLLMAAMAFSISSLLSKFTV